MIYKVLYIPGGAGFLLSTVFVKVCCHPEAAPFRICSSWFFPQLSWLSMFFWLVDQLPTGHKLQQWWQGNETMTRFHQIPRDPCSQAEGRLPPELQITAPWYLEGLQWAPSWGQLQYSNWIQLAKLFCNISKLEEIKRSQESPGEAPIHQLPRFGLNRYGFWTLAVDAALTPVSRVHCMSRNISIKLMCSMCFTGIHVCHWSCLSNGCKSIRLVGHLNQGKESIKSCSNSSGPWRWKLVISLIGVMGRNF